MKIYIMRHGEAEMFANSDAERNLTPRGEQASVAVAQKCVSMGIEHFDQVLVSPYVRAQQTWQQISQCFQAKHLDNSDDITPYGDALDVAQFLYALAESKTLDSILLVSHLPLVGYLTAELAQGISPPMFPTSGLACVEVDVERQSGELLWQVTA
jgi:phosphohistidine phosphatase